ncbi:MAG: hypothetical protein EOP50_03435 [Sphingobacteriales bacterium]|nr:MAG: hypothetical protein EOP50_03435 [Sphingobacteriales bacterium]
MKQLTLLCLLLVAGFGIAAQQHITVCASALTPVDKFNAVDGEGQIAITQKHLRDADVILYICKSLGVTKVSYKNGGDIPVDNTNDDGPQFTDKLKYRIPKDRNYKADALVLIFTIKNKAKEFIIKTAQSAAASDTEHTEKEIADCKRAQLLKLHYDFNLTGLYKLLSDTCGEQCHPGCPSGDNIVVYDFATNATAKENWKSKNKKSVKVGDPLQFWIRRTNPPLYHVTIASEADNYHDETNSLLDLLKADVSKLAAVNSFNGDNCILVLSDSLLKAFDDMQAQLRRLRKNLSPYTDAYCLRRHMLAARDSVDAAFARSFPITNITDYEHALAYATSDTDHFSAAMIQSITTAYAITAESNYGYYFKIPEVQDVDVVRFRFNILGRDSTLALPHVKDGSIRVRTHGGFKVDVSSGLYYAFGLFDERFAMRPDSVLPAGATTYQKGNRVVPKEEDNAGEFGFSSFLHFYPRTGGKLNVSLSIGAGLNFSDKPRPRYFSGISFLFGQESRMGLTFGYVFGNVDRLSRRYTESNGVYDLVPESETTVQYRKVFQGRGFLSLTYSLPFFNQKQQAQEATAPK